MQKWFVFIVLLLCPALLTAAPDAMPDDSITFSQAREIILTQNSGLKSAATETEAAKAGIGQAGALPNPNAGIALDGFGLNSIEVTIDQTFELGGKRRFRTASAQKSVEAAQNTVTLTRLDLEAEIVRRFIPIASATRKLALLDSILLLAESAREQIQKRVDAGASKKTDLIRAEIDIEQISLERGEVFREKEQARRKFAALGGGKDEVLMDVRGSISDEIVVPSINELRDAARANPQVKAAGIEQDRLGAQKRQLQAEGAPDLNLSAGYLRDNAGNANSPLVGASMTIPLFNTNAPAQRQAELQRQAAGERRDNMLRLLDADILDLHSRLIEMDRRIAALKTNAIPKTMYVHATMQEYYNAGSVGFLDLATSQSEMLRLRMELLDVETERAQTLADLMQTTSFQIHIVK